jgi:hypothetical protein
MTKTLLGRSGLLGALTSRQGIHVASGGSGGQGFLRLESIVRHRVHFSLGPNKQVSNIKYQSPTRYYTQSHQTVALIVKVEGRTS